MEISNPWRQWLRRHSRCLSARTLLPTLDNNVGIKRVELVTHWSHFLQQLEHTLPALGYQPG